MLILHETNRSNMIFLKKYKYLIIIVLFFLWMVLFDSNSVGRQLEYLSVLNKLEQESDFYMKEISENQSSTTELVTNIDKLERYAREKYLMKKENEDVFIIIDEADSKELEKKK